MKTKTDDVPFGLSKVDPTRPAFECVGNRLIVADAITVIGTDGTNHHFESGREVLFDADHAAPGTDFAVVLTDDGNLAALAWAGDLSEHDHRIGGFHFAPGGNATARQGGDAVPAINPDSIWDDAFRPACADPRGMALDVLPGGRKVWGDIYFTGVGHLENGTSRHGVVIADGGSNLPGKPSGGLFKVLDFQVAQQIAAHHGKRLLSFEEFASGAYGVTERSSDDDKAALTGLSMARTSRRGWHQATGQRWTWGTDGDPDDPRASLLGGSWIDRSDAGSRFAPLDYWPGSSDEGLGLRLASDHLTAA